MIPQDKSEAVRRALREAFGVDEPDETVMLKGLASSMVFRIAVRGTPYVLKISLRTNDPARHYACMRAAAEAGIAPRVWYTSIEDRISITDWVETAPFPSPERLVRVPAMLRALHALPLFPGRPDGINTTCTFLFNQGPMVDGFFQSFQSSGILPKADVEQMTARYAQLYDAYSHHGPELVSSHNDLFKPENILFDGNRAWLIDWEAAFSNDRYADLAAAANLVAASEADQALFLRTYFGTEPDEYQRARFFLMQQLVHMFYAVAFLLQAAAAGPIDFSEPPPDFVELHRSMWTGEADLTSAAGKAALGRGHWNRLAENLKNPRLDEALRMVSV